MRNPLDFAESKGIQELIRHPRAKGTANRASQNYGSASTNGGVPFYLGVLLRSALLFVVYPLILETPV